MLIVFVRDTTNSEDTALHKSGDVLDVPETSANRWIKRGAAEIQKTPAEPKQTRKEKK